jgi:hypothetical protein
MNRRSPAAMALLMLGCAFLAATCPAVAGAAQKPTPTAVFASTSSTSATGSAAASASAAGEGGSLESAASKAGDMGRKIAISLIGLGLAVAAIRLAFHRNFKEATGVVVLGLLAVLLASPVGESLLQNTVSTVFGS